LVAIDGEDVARRGRELHGQIRDWDDSAEGVKRRAAKEDIVGCGHVNDKEADGNGFGLGSIAKHGVKVNVAAGGNLFAREAINWFVIWNHGSVQELEFLIGGPAEDVDRVALVNKFFYFILECFAIFYSVAMVAVVATILGHISIRGSGCLTWWRNEVSCRASSRRRDRATIRGAYMVKRGWRGSRGRVSGRGGCGVGLAEVVA